MDLIQQYESFDSYSEPNVVLSQTFSEIHISDHDTQDLDIDNQMDVLGEESDPNFNDKIGDNSYQKLDVNLSTGVIVDKQNEVDNHEVIEGHEDDGAARAIESQSNEPMLDETSEMNSSDGGTNATASQNSNQSTNTADHDRRTDISEAEVSENDELRSNHSNEDTSESSQPSRQKKKRNRRKERQKRRNTGKSYVTSNGTHVKKRTCVLLPNCQRGCKTSITREDQMRTFNSYWSQGSYPSRKLFVRGLLKIVPVARRRGKKNKQTRRYSVKYFLNSESGDVEVCKACFRLTLGETKSFIENVCDTCWESNNAQVTEDLRGKAPAVNKTSPERIQEVIDHINKFPTYQSHYSRQHTQKKYLGIGLSVAKMYSLYKSEYQTNDDNQPPVSERIYREEFNKTGLKFRPPQLDTCYKCDSLDAKIKYETDEVVKAELRGQKERHLAMADWGYVKKAEDKINAKDSNGTEITSTFDLQKCLPTPLLRSSVAFYLRPLWTYNLTINNSVSKKSKCFMWHESLAKRGANEIGSCLHEFLKNVDPSVKHITFYSDQCGGQNKNKIIAGALSAIAASHETVDIIDHKFLESGHTHMECDNDHSVIEKAKKRLNPEIHHPFDWYQLVRDAKRENPFEVIEMNQDMFFDFENLFKTDFVMRKTDANKDPFLFRNVRWFRFSKEKGIIQYKSSLDVNEPFKVWNIERKNVPPFSFDNLKVRYTKPNKISNEKKKDLLTVLPLLRPNVRDFYQNLSAVNTESNVEIDPDLDHLEEAEGPEEAEQPEDPVVQPSNSRRSSARRSAESAQNFVPRKSQRIRKQT